MVVLMQLEFVMHVVNVQFVSQQSAHAFAVSLIFVDAEEFLLEVVDLFGVGHVKQMRKVSCRTCRTLLN